MCQVVEVALGLDPGVAAAAADEPEAADRGLDAVVAAVELRAQAPLGPDGQGLHGR